MWDEKRSEEPKKQQSDKSGQTQTNLEQIHAFHAKSAQSCLAVGSVETVFVGFGLLRRVASVRVEASGRHVIVSDTQSPSKIRQVHLGRRLASRIANLQTNVTLRYAPEET